MAELVLGNHYSIGPREIYEDRVMTTSLVSAAGQKLTLAIVADGVGGQAKGERASQLAVDTLIKSIQRSQAPSIPDMLEEAFQRANRAVVQAAQSAGVKGMSTTLTAAVVDDADQLFVANVGDSSAYLIRNGKLTKLTKDHTYANIMVWRGKLSAEEAAEHERSEVVLWALGLRERLQVDLGFYVGTDDYRDANVRGRKGIPLRAGDSVLVCSDGLVKDSSITGEPLIKEDEIIRTMESSSGDQAARTLVAFALGREPNDNVSAATIHVDPASTPVPQAVPEAGMSFSVARLIPWLLAGFLLLIGLLAGFGWWRTNRSLRSLVAGSTEQAQVQPTEQSDNQQAPTNTMAPSATSPPTATPAPATPEPVVLLSGATSQVIEPGEILTAGDEPMIIGINPRSNDVAGGGILAFGPGTQGSVVEVAPDQWRIKLLAGGSAFLQDGAAFQLASAEVDPVGGLFNVRSGCLAISSSADQGSQSFELSCFAGDCQYAEHFAAEPISLANGFSYQIGELGGEPGNGSALDQSAALNWLEAFQSTDSGDPQVPLQCIQSYIQGTPAPASNATPDPTEEQVTPEASPTPAG